MKSHKAHIKAIAALAIAQLIAAAAVAEDVRLFFSTDDPIGAGHPPLPVPAGNGAMNVAAATGNPLRTPPEFTERRNAELPPGVGRLHLWLMGDPEIDNVWNRINVDVRISGPATIRGGGGLNVTTPTQYRRWETLSDFNPNGNPARWDFIAALGAGARMPPLYDGWDSGIDAVYLGYIDVDDHGARSEIRLALGPSGITRRSGGVGSVAFGWGDDPLQTNQFGASTTIADAIVGAPEPATVAMFVGVGMMISRRIRRHA